MASEQLSDALRLFLQGRLESVEQVETLLLLYRTSPREWSAGMVSRELRSDLITAARRLNSLEAIGLISVRAENDIALYWYEGAEDPMVRELERAYRERRTSLISALVEPASEDLRAFADAFRIRRRPDRPGGRTR